MSIILRSLALALLVCLASPAVAMKVRVEVTGSVVFVDGSLSSAFPLGTPMSGFFEYLPPGTDDFPSTPGFGEYEDALTSFSLTLESPTIGSYTAASTGVPSAGQIQVSDSGSDSVQVNTTPASGLVGGAVNGLSLIRGHFFFNGPGTVLSSDALPTPAEMMAFPVPDPNSFGNLAFSGGFIGGQVSARYDTVISFIPVPASIALLPFPLVVLARLRGSTVRNRIS